MAKLKPTKSLTESVFRKVISHYNEQDDREVALVATAWLDDALEQYLRTSLRPDGEVFASLFRSDGGIGSFGNRIKLAYMMGILEESVFRDLDMIRSIRNDFAHFRENLTFNNQSIKDRCNNLRTIQVFNKFVIEPVCSAKDKFVVAVTILVYYILDGAKFAEPPEGITVSSDTHGVYTKDIAESVSKKIGVSSQ